MNVISSPIQFLAWLSIAFLFQVAVRLITDLLLRATADWARQAKLLHSSGDCSHTV